MDKEITKEITEEKVTEQVVEVLDRFKQALINQDKQIQKLKEVCETAITTLESLNQLYESTSENEQ